MRVYVANFGRGNWAWPDCLARNSIAIQDDVSIFPFWEQQDRDGYIRKAQSYFRLPNGRPVPERVASRWFNLLTEFHETTNDFWVHHAGEELWWTLSTDAPPSDEIIDDPSPPLSDERRIHVFHKPCLAWSNRNRNNLLLRWKRIHPKARKFLFAVSTFHALTTDNAAYARAQISGDPLSNWHERPDWLREARREPGWAGPI